MASKFSEKLDVSFRGRSIWQDEPPEQKMEVSNKSVSSATYIRPSADAPYGYKKDGITPKKKPGRKEIGEENKSHQVVLTLGRDVYDALADWSADKPRSLTRLLSAYIEDHYKDIIE